MNDQISIFFVLGNQADLFFWTCKSFGLWGVELDVA